MTLFEELSIESGIKEAVEKAWGTDVKLRSLNAAEIIEYHEGVDAAAPEEKKVEGVILLVHTMVTEEGVRVAPADRSKFTKLLLTKDFRSTQSLVRKARELNGLGLTTPAKTETHIKNG